MAAGDVKETVLDWKNSSWEQAASGPAHHGCQINWSRLSDPDKNTSAITTFSFHYESENLQSYRHADPRISPPDTTNRQYLIILKVIASFHLITCDLSFEFLTSRQMHAKVLIVQAVFHLEHRETDTDRQTGLHTRLLTLPNYVTAMKG